MEGSEKHKELVKKEEEMKKKGATGAKSKMAVNGRRKL